MEKTYYYNHKEERLEYQKQYNKENKKYIKEYQHEYYLKYRYQNTRKYLYSQQIKVNIVPSIIIKLSED
jgi:hypothetical protein